MPTFPRAPGFPSAPGQPNFPPAPPGGGVGGVGPRSVSFTQRRSGGGMTLDALMARQKDAAARQQEALQTPQTTIPGGIGQMITSFTQGLRQHRAEQEEQRGHQVISDVFSHMDPATGATAEQMAAIGEYDPDMMIKLWSDRATRLNQEKWTPIPTPEGENGQWFQNQQGDTKKVGGGSPGEGGWKPTDIAARADDYMKAAAQYNTSAPSWQSMKNSAAIALNPDTATEGKGAADYDMIVGWAKLLDPGSVVRETEVQSASMTGGTISQINGWLNTIRSKGSLDDSTRRAIMNQAQSRVSAYYDQAKGYHDWISSVATRNKVNPDDIVPPLAEFQGWTDQAAPEEEPPPYNQPGSTATPPATTPPATTTSPADTGTGGTATAPVDGVEGWPPGTTEESIQATMKQYKMTREQVKAGLSGKDVPSGR